MRSVRRSQSESAISGEWLERRSDRCCVFEFLADLRYARRMGTRLDGESRSNKIVGPLVSQETN